MVFIEMVYLDGAQGGPWMGHLLDEVGCMWLASGPAEAEAQAPAAIAEFMAWLRQHGEPGIGDLADVVPLTVTVEDVQEIPHFGQSGAAVGLFVPDFAALTDLDIAAAVRRLGYARQDMLATVAGLPATVLDWEPPGGKRTIRQNLRHITNAQCWYLTRVLGHEAVARILPDPWPEEIFERMHWVMEQAVNTLLDLPPSLRSGLYRAEGPTEDWTPRKMLRRFVEHELEHLDVVRMTIKTWRNEQK